MKIAYNAAAIRASNALTRNDDRLSASLGRLSSGLKVVNAKDNPSGLAMARRMNAQIESLTKATQNSSDAISVIETADGALSEVHDILQRINELATKASTETMTDGDRELVQKEVKALKEEITRIAQTTEFNGQKILDGSFDLKGYTNQVSVKVSTYSDEVPQGTYQIPGLNVAFDANGNIDLSRVTLNLGTPPAAGGLPAGTRVTAADGKVITLTGADGFELKLELKDTAISGYTNLEVNIAGYGSMDTQVGANEGQQLNVRIYKLSLENMGIGSIDLTTAEGAREALDKMPEALRYVSSARSHIGAYQNRLDHIVNNLDLTKENMTSAYSRIMDVDMAEEMTQYTTLQVLSQASTSMLAQANERPAQVLQLLQ